MTSYMVALGWSQVNSLSRVIVQPSSPGLLFGAFETSVLGLSVPQGRAYTIWNYGILTPDQLTTLLTQFGLSDTVKSRKVTVATRDDYGFYLRRNCYIGYPENGRQMRREVAFWRNVSFLLAGLRVP